MKELLQKQKTTFIATIDENNFPQASYAPFVIKEDKIYIYISSIAEHYKNLEQNGKISLMIIEDESDSKILFARKRVSFNGTAKKVESVSDDILAQFDENHTKSMMDVLKTMDFSFFEVSISKGRLVEGFGKAFDLKYVNGEWNQEHVVLDGGHKTKPNH